jgi:predicted DNA-binding protein
MYIYEMAQEPNMKQTSLFLKPEQMGRLQELSRKTGAPVAELIRRAIDAYMEQRKREFGRG